MKNLKHSQSGRTMLEMLGVLGIMGIIMYGAIAGINYGMSTYKINQTYNEVQEAMQGIQDLFSWSRNYDNIDVTLLTDNDILTGTENAFGGTIVVKKDDCRSGSSECRTFKLIYSVSDDAARARLMEMEWGEVDAQEDGSQIIFTPKD